MICRNCGFSNAAGDEFCGSCGQFLEWSGEAAGGTATGGTGTAGAAGAGASATGAGGTAGGATTGADPAAVTRTYDAAPPPPPPPPPGTWSTTGTPGGASQAPATSGAAAFGGPDIICWNCSRRNPASRAFCQQCGERLVAGAAGATAPVGGTRPMPVPSASTGDGRGRLVIIGGLVLLLALVGGGAFALMRGQGGTPSATLPGSSGIAGSPSASLPSLSFGPSGDPSGDPSGEPTEEPTGEEPTEEPTGEEPTEEPTGEEPTEEPTGEEPTEEPTEPTETPTGVASGRFDCEQQEVIDRSPTKWLIASWQVTQPPEHDQLVLNIFRQPGKAPEGGGTTVTAEIVANEEVEERFGVTNTTQGEKTLVVRMPSPVRVNGVLESDKLRPAIQGFRVQRGNDGAVYALVGMQNPSCYDLQIPLWEEFFDPPSPAQIIVDVRRP